MRLRAAVLATAAAAAADTLAIVTEFRSGSTLLGGLVANASTFYFFEPCRLLGGDHNRKVASGSCDALVPRLLACDAALGDKVWREVAAKDRGFLGHRVGATKPAAVVAACAARERVAKVTSCVEIKILRSVRAEPSRRPPRYRRDACSMAWRCRFLTARRNQRGRAIAEK